MQRREINMKTNLRLRDLFLLGIPDAYMVHDKVDVGFIFTDASLLTGQNAEKFAELLNAPVAGIQAGAYGAEIVLTDIDPQILTDFDQAAADAVQAGYDIDEDEDAGMVMQ